MILANLTHPQCEETRNVLPQPLAARVGSGPSGASSVADCGLPPRVETFLGHCRWLLLALAIAWLGAEWTALAGYAASPSLLFLIGAGSDPFFALVLACAFGFYLWTSPGSREALVLSASGIGLAVALHLAHLFPEGPNAGRREACLAFTLVLLGRLAWRARQTGPSAAWARVVLVPTVLLVGFNVLKIFCMVLTVDLYPATLDVQAFLADEKLGGQWSFVLGRFLDEAPVLRIICLAIYNTLPLLFILVLVMELRSPKAPPVEIFLPYLAAGLAGYALSMAFPVICPAFFFPDAWPHTTPSAAALVASPPVPEPTARTGMPSLHTAWVLLAFWHARPLGRRVRLLAGTYVVFTLLATLGLGQHYVVDLIVAFPFVLAVQAACTPRAVGWARYALTPFALTGPVPTGLPRPFAHFPGTQD